MNAIQTNEQSDTTHELLLSGQLNVARASDLLVELKNARSTCPHLLIQASSLESMDTSILQVLVAANQAFESVLVENTSPAWAASFQRAGLSDPFTTASEKN